MAPPTVLVRALGRRALIAARPPTGRTGLHHHHYTLGPRRAYTGVAGPSASPSPPEHHHHPPPPPADDQPPPTVIRPTAAEVAAQALSARHLEAAVRALHADGLVVVEGVVPTAALDRLNARMVADARALQARGDKGPYNYNQGNLQLDAPPVADFFDPAVFANPIATQITSSVLGPRPRWTFNSANAAMPAAAAQRQPVHSDADFAHPAHPFALVVNVPLVDMTPANGATEVWLGTHRGDAAAAAQEGAHGERASGRIRAAALAARRARRPPLQPAVPRGALVVRDLRLWHAGMPNTADAVRVMLAMIHFAPWYRNRMRLCLADDVAPLLRAADVAAHLEVPVDWVSRTDALASYLDRGFGNSYDFDQEA